MSITESTDRPLASPDQRHRPQGAGDVGGQASTIDAGLTQAGNTPDSLPDIEPANKPQPVDADWADREAAAREDGTETELPDSEGVKRSGVRVNDDDNVLESLGKAITDPLRSAADDEQPGQRNPVR